MWELVCCFGFLQVVEGLTLMLGNISTALGEHGGAIPGASRSGGSKILGRRSTKYHLFGVSLQFTVMEVCFIWGGQTETQACSTPVKEIK